MIVAQMHDNTQSADSVADQSSMEIAFTDTVDRPATSLRGIDLGWLSRRHYSQVSARPAQAVACSATGTDTSTP